MGAMSRYPLVAAALSVVLAAAPPAAAQTKPPKQASLSNLLKAAYSLRRQGKFKAASAAYEAILRRLTKKSPYFKHKFPIAMELAELYKVTGQERKAIRLFRRNHDTKREIETLLAMKDKKRHEEALVVARLMKYREGEALANGKLGKAEVGLKLLEGQGKKYARARGELLLQLKRYKEAADQFFAARDYHAQAKALSLTSDTKQARRAWEDAVDKIKFRIKEQVRPKLKKAKAAFKAAKPGVARERTRLFLARCYAEASEAYRQWAASFAGVGNGKNAVRTAKTALKYLAQQRSTLEDLAGGGDAYGKQAVKAFGIPGRVAEIQAEQKKYETLPQSPK